MVNFESGGSGGKWLSKQFLGIARVPACILPVRPGGRNLLGLRHLSKTAAGRTPTTRETEYAPQPAAGWVIQSGSGILPLNSREKIKRLEARFYFGGGGRLIPAQKNL